jgi:uncharacterized LabA/DUF88 family protein
VGDKGVDAAIVTELLTLAPMADLALVDSGDADVIPATEQLLRNSSVPWPRLVGRTRV